jgi:hypothetical protein
MLMDDDDDEDDDDSDSLSLISTKSSDFSSTHSRKSTPLKSILTPQKRPELSRLSRTEPRQPSRRVSFSTQEGRPSPKSATKAEKKEQKAVIKKTSDNLYQTRKNKTPDKAERYVRKSLTRQFESSQPDTPSSRNLRKRSK